MQLGVIRSRPSFLAILFIGWMAGCTPAVPPDPALEYGGVMPLEAAAPEPQPASEPAEPQPAADAGPLNGRDGRALAFEEFRPQPMLVVPKNRRMRAKFPVVDVHMHPRIRHNESSDLLDEYVKIMDEQNIAVSVSLDGRLGELFEDHARYLWSGYEQRFVIFANIDFRGEGEPDDPATWDCHQSEFPRRIAASLVRTKERGASGLKLFKEFGLGYRNPDGSLIKIDDPRWDPIWEACGRLGLVVIMHTADPSAFFRPIDETNERWEELHRHPEWSFAGEEWPARSELLEARNRVIERHPKTTFICAHMANDAENLAEVGQWLDRYPNMYVEMAARLAELGRQPYTARDFFIKYADRIMFGSDGPRVRERLYPHWRFLETRDEYFRYAENPFPPQGFWYIYGIGLPDDVLKKVYHENAARIIPGVKEKLQTYLELQEAAP